MKVPLDPRSTYRKRARSILLARDDIPFICNVCKKSPEQLLASGSKQGRMSLLQADHMNKDISDCDPANLQWVCASCHRLSDNKTAKGISPVEEDNRYGLFLEIEGD